MRARKLRTMRWVRARLPTLENESRIKAILVLGIAENPLISTARNPDASLISRPD